MKNENERKQGSGRKPEIGKATNTNISFKKEEIELIDKLLKENHYPNRKFAILDAVRLLYKSLI